MAKVSKTSKQNTPQIYAGLMHDPKNLKRCIMEDLNGVYSIFENRAQLEALKSFEELIKPTIQKLWDNFDNFVDTCNEQTALCYHENLFDGNPPKKQDLLTTKIHIWHKFVTLCKNSLVDATGTPKDPVTNRKSTILNCVYTPGEIREGSADVRTYQALKCLELFREALSDKESITEGDLKQYILDHAAVLKTRQDPWRIFQYYRPTLIAAKLLRRS